jgi:hypothetical protein
LFGSFRWPKVVVPRVHQAGLDRRLEGAIERHPKCIRASSARILTFKGDAPLLFRDRGDAVGEAGCVVNYEDAMFLDRVRQCSARCESVLFGRSQLWPGPVFVESERPAGIFWRVRRRKERHGYVVALERLDLRRERPGELVKGVDRGTGACVSRLPTRDWK